MLRSAQAQSIDREIGGCGNIIQILIYDIYKITIIIERETGRVAMVSVDSRSGVMMKSSAMNVVLFGGVMAFAGCASHHGSSVRGADDQATKLTVGNVQRSIEKGMTGAQVAEALGSPNIVSTDENGREVWIYDRFATEVITSQSSAGWFFLIGAAGSSSGASRTSQRSLTVVIKYDEQKKVRDVAYHASSF